MLRNAFAADHWESTACHRISALPFRTRAWLMHNDIRMMMSAHLAAAMGPSPNANGGDLHFCSHARSQSWRYALQQQAEAPCILP